MRFIVVAAIAATLATLGIATVQAATTISFEEIGDSEPLADQYSALGVRFVNGTVLKSGVSLNEIDFPPHAGSSVATDDGIGVLVIQFAEPVSSVSAWFTYSDSLVVDVFDAFDNLLGSFGSSGSNVGASTLFGLEASGIARLSFDRTSVGSYVLDELRFEFATAPPPPPSVAEPSTLATVMLSLAFLLALCSYKARGQA